MKKLFLLLGVLWLATACSKNDAPTPIDLADHSTYLVDTVEWVFTYPDIYNDTITGEPTRDTGRLAFAYQTNGLIDSIDYRLGAQHRIFKYKQDGARLSMQCLTEYGPLDFDQTTTHYYLDDQRHIVRWESFYLNPKNKEELKQAEGKLTYDEKGHVAQSILQYTSYNNTYQETEDWNWVNDTLASAINSNRTRTVNVAYSDIPNSEQVNIDLNWLTASSPTLTNLGFLQSEVKYIRMFNFVGQRSAFYQRAEDSEGESFIYEYELNQQGIPSKITVIRTNNNESEWEKAEYIIKYRSGIASHN